MQKEARAQTHSRVLKRHFCSKLAHSFFPFFHAIAFIPFCGFSKAFVGFLFSRNKVVFGFFFSLDGKNKGIN